MTGYSKMKKPTYSLGGFLPLAQAGASMIPGVGSAISAGLGLVGGLLNAGEQKKEQRKLNKAQAEQMVKQQEQVSLSNLAGYSTNGTYGVQYYKRGGKIANPQYEVEKDEVVQGDATLEESNQIASDLQVVGGNSHEQGGTDGSGGERVFSDSIRINKALAEILKPHGVKSTHTYAKAAEILGKQKGKMEKKLEGNFAPAINTAKRSLGEIEGNLNVLFDVQEQSKPATEQKPTQMFDLGGIIKGAGTFIKNNEGHLLNGLSYLSNMNSIKKLNTNVSRNYLPTPNYNYTDRSGLAKQTNQVMFNNAASALSTSSAGANASNMGALFGETLNRNNEITNAENVRRDGYDTNYFNRSDRVQAINTNIMNEASDQRRDLYNEKNVAMPLNARNSFMQGYAGNRAVEYQKKLDKAKLAISMFKNNENGVFDRLDPNALDKMMKSPLFQFLNK